MKKEESLGEYKMLMDGAVHPEDVKEFIKRCFQRMEKRKLEDLKNTSVIMEEFVKLIKQVITAFE